MPVRNDSNARLVDKNLIMCQNLIVRLQVAVGMVPGHGVKTIYFRSES